MLVQKAEHLRPLRRNARSRRTLCYDVMDMVQNLRGECIAAGLERVVGGLDIAYEASFMAIHAVRPPAAEVDEIRLIQARAAEWFADIYASALAGNNALDTPRPALRSPPREKAATHSAAGRASSK
jgi:hypothetical protein